MPPVSSTSGPGGSGGTGRRPPSGRPPARRPTQPSSGGYRRGPRVDPAVYRRRRIAAGIVVVAVLLIFILLVDALFSGGSGHSSTTTSPSTTKPPTLGVGMRSVTWTDPRGLAVNPAPNGSATPRTLVTQIWYPSLGASAGAPTPNAAPDYSGGPFPIIVFAHGFDTLPSTYEPLLDSYVLAGFVVVAPLFPDENADKIASLGDPPPTSEVQVAESDVINEPYDVAYVVNQSIAAAQGVASTNATWMRGLADPTKVALAGHSDGAQVVAALTYASAYTSTYQSLKVRPFAVEILSGSEFPASEVGTYAAPSPAPDALSVQSATDQCNLPQDAAQLATAIGSGSFLKLTDASHFGPVVGDPPAAVPTEKTTAGFLTNSDGTSTADLQQVGTVSGVSELYSPSQTPAITSLPTPTPAEQVAACAPPAASASPAGSSGSATG